MSPPSSRLRRKAGRFGTGQWTFGIWPRRYWPWGQFFEVANKELNGKRASVRTQVMATKEGSFVVSLVLDNSLIQDAIDLLSDEQFPNRSAASGR